MALVRKESPPARRVRSLRAFTWEFFSDFDAARENWGRMERLAAASPYQSYAFCRAWSETEGARLKLRPLIAVARDAADGEIAALLPLAFRRFAGVSTATWMGGRMSNYAMALIPEPQDWTRAEAEALVGSLIAAARLDLVFLPNQPLAWRGVVNPLALLSDAPSPSFAYCTQLTGDFELWDRARFSANARKKRRAKIRKLTEIGPVAHACAVGAEARRLAFEAFLAQKRARMRERRLPDEFTRASTRALIERLAELDVGSGRAPQFEFHTLSAGERIVAVFGGFLTHDRLSGLIFSHDIRPDVAPMSPGELLIAEIVRDAHARGLAAFDLGIGEARYKSEVCEVIEPLVDAAYGSGPIGRIAASLYLLARGAETHNQAFAAAIRPGARRSAPVRQAA